MGSGADGALTMTATPCQCGVSGGVHVLPMSEDEPGAAIRQAIGGDSTAVAWILASAETSVHAVVVSMAVLLEGRPTHLARAEGLAVTSRDRQVVAITRAHLAGDSELVDALARDHLVSHPDSLIVSWIASDPGLREGMTGQP